MVTASGEPLLELSVRNFGPIAEADIELRPLSVFVGPSNTGKSYLATLIYALHRFFSLGHVPVHEAPYNHPMLSRRLSTLAPLAHAAVSAEEIRRLYEWAHSEWSKGGSAGRIGALLLESDLPADIAELVKRFLHGDEQSYKALDDEAVRCFGTIGSGRLVRWPRGDASSFSVRGMALCQSNQRSSVNYKVDLGDRGVYVKTEVPEKIPIAHGSAGPIAHLTLAPEDAEELRPIFARLQLMALAGVVLSRCVGPLSKPAHYLPADRAGAVRSRAALTGTLISRASRPSSASQQPTLSGIYGDFLEGLVGLGGSSTKMAGTFDTLADSMEHDILGGKIRVDSNLAGYPSFFYRRFDWDTDLPLMNASSMVSELAPVVLYLRHVVQPGETLIIEEPESALHPAMQVEFTRLLAAAVKAGIRIIITTHSEWILEELANLVRLSELPPERRNGIEDPDVALGHDEVGAWFFECNDEAGGSVVREIPLDTESGTFPAGYGLVTESLYQRWSTINRRVRKAQ